MSISSVLRAEAEDGAARRPASADAAVDEPVLAFGVALANALAEAGSPPARLEIDATLWASTAGRGSPIARAELRIAGQASELVQSTLEECAWRVARGGESEPGPFGAAEVSLTAVVAAPPRSRTGRVRVPPGPGPRRTDDVPSATTTEPSSADAAVDAWPTETIGRNLGPPPPRPVLPVAGRSEPPRRLRRRWLVWLALAALLLAIVYAVARAHLLTTGAILAPGGLLPFAL